MLLHLLAPQWNQPRRALEPAVRRYLRPKRRGELLRLATDRGVALAAVAALLATATTQALPPVALSDIAAGNGGFVISGVDALDYSGLSVSAAGDVNGDGFADVIVGAPFASRVGAAYAGESYVVFGSTSTTAVALSDIAAGVGGFVINGIASFDRSGGSVSGAGDVNGDGLDDVVIGAQYAYGDASLAGESYVVFGKTDTAAVDLSDVAAGAGGFVITGIAAGDRSGRSVSGAGDVNGDGLADVIIGAQYADPGGAASAGESYVVFGKATTTEVSLADVAAGLGGGFAIDGEAAGDYSGTSVSGAGDVDGDGLADVIIGAPNADGAAPGSGRSYVVFGKASFSGVSLAAVALANGGFVANGIGNGDQSGLSVSGAGDVNGDGLADVVIGAHYATGETNFSGQSYVVFGKANGTPVNLSDVAAGAGGFAINGAEFGDLTGRSVSGAGDVDGDCLADILVGAEYAEDTVLSTGQSYLVFGKASTAAVDLSDVEAGLNGFVMRGVDTLDYSGVSVSGAGDVNGDCLADLIVGAPGADPGGESYVVFSPASTGPNVHNVGIFRNALWFLDTSGNNQAGAGDTMFTFGLPNDIPVRGDWNGDGTDEIGIFRNGLWFLDMDGSNTVSGDDALFGFGLATDTPVVGDWNADGTDEIGIFRNGLWFLDLDGNRQAGLEDTFFGFGLPGDVPVPGNWNGAVGDEVAIFRNGLWFLDLSGDRKAGADDTYFVFGLPTDVPIVGDWNGLPGDEVGIFRNGVWFLDVTGDNQAGAGDTFFLFGLPTDDPVPGGSCP